MPKNSEIRAYATERGISYAGAYYRLCQAPKRRERSRLYYQQHRDVILARLRARTAANPAPNRYNKKSPFWSLYSSSLVKTITDKIKKCPDFSPEVMSYEQFLKFTKIYECHYCGWPIEWYPYNLAVNGRRYNLDRKDNSLGYTVDNCVVCCTRCNHMKSDDVPYEVFLEIGKVIRIWNRDKAGR